MFSKVCKAPVNGNFVVVCWLRGSDLNNWVQEPVMCRLCIKTQQWKIPHGNHLVISQNNGKIHLVRWFLHQHLHWKRDCSLHLTARSEQLSYPLESAKFPIRIYPMGQVGRLWRERYGYMMKHDETCWVFGVLVVDTRHFPHDYLVNSSWPFLATAQVLDRASQVSPFETFWHHVYVIYVEWVIIKSVARLSGAPWGRRWSMVLMLGAAAPSGIPTLGQAVYTGLPWFTNIGITNLAVVQHPRLSIVSKLFPQTCSSWESSTAGCRKQPDFEQQVWAIERYIDVGAYNFWDRPSI